MWCVNAGGALVASSLCKYLSRKADGEEQIDLSSDMMDHSQWVSLLVSMQRIVCTKMKSYISTIIRILVEFTDCCVNAYTCIADILKIWHKACWMNVSNETRILHTSCLYENSTGGNKWLCSPSLPLLNRWTSWVTRLVRQNWTTSGVARLLPTRPGLRSVIKQWEIIRVAVIGRLSYTAILWLVILQILGALFMPALIWTIKFVSGDADDDADTAEEIQPGNNQVAPITATIDQPPPLQSRTPDNGDANGSHNTRKANVCDAPHLFYTAPMIKFSYDIVSATNQVASSLFNSLFVLYLLCKKKKIKKR